MIEDRERIVLSKNKVDHSFCCVDKICIDASISLIIVSRFTDSNP